MFFEVDDMKRIEKIEIAKHNGSFYYTGMLSVDSDDSDWVLIETTRGESLRFRKEQIMQRKVLDTKGDDMNEGKKSS